ncbi:hypothetical protein A2982_03410 [candidate division WWE3 bacterium RIFCSPLOWO2_01_FULL_39_13]|uniref:GIY-YIG domain-containing protein n=1 Tax=candidate division WWE3 bacterium RIFCSPLOWO2_01_FULL_39_13 TaxID=1802624 RepID=A0A1F4V3D8_UNCKA|nr:MAG: hypothetical protein A2982_03410 [candidate division WWE3 bacterium RIFCSPLOWO2_01_FULL_39_13]
MYYVYVLRQKNNRFYYGYTNNLDRRMLEHLNGQVRTTRGQKPVLIYFECYKKKFEAERREKFIKSGRGREQIKKKLGDNLNL